MPEIDEKKIQESVKKAAEELVTEMETKLSGFDEKIQEKIDLGIKESRESIEGKMQEHTKQALESLSKEAAEVQEKYQKQLDEMATKLARVDVKSTKFEKKTSIFQDFITKTLESDQFKSWANADAPARKAGTEIPFSLKDDGEIDFEVKAGDMTSSNTYTNDVFDVTRNTEIIFDPDRARHVRELMPNGTMTGTAFEYIQETAYDDGAGETAEGSSATQSDFDLTQQTANHRRIDTYLLLTEEMLMDTAGLRSYILTRVPSKIKVEEDASILYGTGVAPQLSGITVSGAAYSDNLADTNVQRWDVLRDAIRQVRVNEYFATAILLHPTDFSLLELEKDTQGRYILPSMLTGTTPNISRVPIVETTAMTSGDFLVGDFMKGAMVLDRQASTIGFYEQDSTNIRSSEITVVAKERLALPIWRTNAFCYGTFSNALALGSA